LLQRHAQGVTCVLVIDDAQNLSVPSLELVRLLCNLETGQEKLLQILLVGQPELETTLAGSDMRQLRSRIVKHARLRGLQRDEVGRYFDFRINAAGGNGRLTITPEAIDLLHRCTGGNLRQMHLLLDRCLYGLAAMHQSRIDKALIQRALADVPELQVRSPRVGLMAVGARWSWRWVAAGAALGLASVTALATWLPWQPSAAWHEWSAWWSKLEAPAAAAEPTATASLATAPAATGAQTPAASAPVSAPSAAGPLVAAPAAAAPMPVPSPEPPSARQRCLDKLGVQAGQTPVREMRVPESMATRYATLDRVCVFQDNGIAWLMLVDSGRAQQIQQAERTVQALQSMLRTAGLFDGVADGLMGPQTRQALARFQKNSGLAATGQPDELTLYLLENQHAAR
jgi:general secretion pathway protein A